MSAVVKECAKFSNAAMNINPSGKAALAIYFRLSAPFLSANEPIIGSVTASQIIEMKLTVPASMGSILMTSVKNTR